MAAHISKQVFLLFLLVTPNTPQGEADEDEGVSTAIDDYKYVGCYIDEEDGPQQSAVFNHYALDEDAILTNQLCAGVCRMRGFRYSGTREHSCFCGNDGYDKLGNSAKDTFCGFLCPGDTKQRCGAFQRVSVYSTFNTNYCLVPLKGQIRCGPAQNEEDCKARTCCFDEDRGVCYHAADPCKIDNPVCSYGSTCNNTKNGTFTCRCPDSVPQEYIDQTGFQCSTKPGNRCQFTVEVECGDDNGEEGCIGRGCCWQTSSNSCFQPDPLISPEQKCSVCNLTVEFDKSADEIRARVTTPVNGGPAP